MTRKFLLVYVFSFLSLAMWSQSTTETNLPTKAPNLISYCKTSLMGNSFDIKSLSISGTTLNYIDAGGKYPISDGSYYSEITPVGANTCSLSPSRTYSLTINTSSSDIVSLWIDYNQNGIFEATEWTQVSTYASAGVNTVCAIVVPANALVGQTTMRIRSRSTGNTNGATEACTAFGSGCTLDFTINIASPSPAKPVVDFYTVATLATPGSQIQLYDQTIGVPTSWKWTFTGGTPATSTLQNPIVSYASNGTYPVKLVATNSIGADSIVKTSFITISNAITMPVAGSRSITTCNALIYDNGGTANYANYSDGATTIYPGTAGDAVKLEFNSFNVQNYDYLYVYDGTTTASALIGTFTGSALPKSVTAMNLSGALTLRFTSDGYDPNAGFVAQVSCAKLILQSIKSTAWTSVIDNNKNGYAQSKLLSFYIKNENNSPATVYSKVYKKLRTNAVYTLISTGSAVSIGSANSVSQSIPLSGMDTKGIYDFKVELYDSSNALLISYDLSDIAALGGHKFESASDDLVPDYVTVGLGGSSFDMSGVSITGTTLVNNTARPTAADASGSYYTEWAPTGSLTCSLTSGLFYTLNVACYSSNLKISAWIDYNQDETFQADEWINVSDATNYSSPVSVTFRVPATALAGQTRMRIRSNYTYSSNGPGDAITRFYNGATEDYTITIVAQTPAVPKAAFKASETNVTFGSTVQFTDQTIGVPTAWKWTLAGATPSTSTDQNPSVLYTTPGTYPVKLVVSNSLGRDSVLKSAYVVVTNSVNVPATGSKTITACGVTVYDSGGTSSYTNSTNGVLTILPSSAKSVVCLKFSEFMTEGYCDYLYVYDGTSISSPLLGSYAGATIPADIYATNQSGALTLRFSSDGSSTYSGFVARATCVPQNTQYVNASSWSNVIDNNQNGFAQSQQLNYTVANSNAVSAATVYAKLYCRRSTVAVDSLLTTSPQFSVAAGSVSTQKLFAVAGFTVSDRYSFKIEIYNDKDSLLSTYDYSNEISLADQKFESTLNDGAPRYCTLNLGGNGFNISAVSILNSTLVNTVTRPAIRTLDGSYYTDFQNSGIYTTSLSPGRSYTLSVSSNSYGVAIGAWFDFNQDKTFQSTEYVAITNSNNSYSPNVIHFTVPSGSPAGTFKMRIRSSNAAINANSACSYYSGGCTEDYTLTLLSQSLIAPVADFSASKTSVNAGEPVTFNDKSINLPTSWKWTFVGATPATSTSENPTVTYSSAGTFQVKLVAKNAYGSDSIVKSNYITVENKVIIPTTGSLTVTSCGTIIQDNGATGMYANSSNGNLIIYPSEAGKMVRIQFSEFSTESCDYLRIYNGNSINSPLIATFSGSNIPSHVTASNPSGVLLLNFSSDGSVVYSGFTATSSCVVPVDYEVKSVSWSNIIDNNYNGYSQSRTLNMILQNNTALKSNMYAKVYYKLSSASAYTFMGQTEVLTVNANSVSESIIFNMSPFQTKGSYDFKIELYSASNQLVSYYDALMNSYLKNQNFETVAIDGQGSYCTYDLGGSGSDITAVSVVGTTLNNVAPRNATSSYTQFSGAGSNTGVLTWGGLNTINVTTSNSDIISMWIDYDHNNSFDAGEWTLVSAASGARVASASFFIPTTALLGQARMRIRTRSAGTVNYSTNACTNFSSGCTEDYTITIDRTSGSVDAKQDAFKVYPNPTRNLIHVEVPGFNTGTLSIVDLVGRHIRTVSVSGSKFTHYVSDLKAGMYFVSIKSDEGYAFTKQLVVQ